MQNNKQGIAHAVRSDARGLGNPVPMPLRGCREATGGERYSARSAKRRKGFGEYGPQCPTGAVAKRLGVNQHRKVLALSCAAPSTRTTLGFRENFNILPLNPLVAGDNHLGDAFAGNNLERLVG